MATDIQPHVAALAQREDERGEGEGDQDRSGVVDGPRTVGVARLGHRSGGDGDAHHSHHGVDPEQSLPAGQTRRGRRPPAAQRRRRPPQRHPTARPRAAEPLPCSRPRAGSGRRPGWSHRRRPGSCDRRSPCRRSSTSAMSTQDATNSSSPSWKIRLRPKTSPSEPDGDDHRRADQRVAGDRPLQRRRPTYRCPR